MNKIILWSFLTLLIAGNFQSLFSQSSQIDKRSGMPIYFEVDEEAFPESWHSADIRAEGKDLDKDQIERSLKVLKITLAKYPIEVLKKNLKKIYVLNEIKFYGVAFGGTNSTDVVYLSNKGISKGYTDEYLERLFHAEFSSILLRNYKSNFPESQWLAANEPGTKYGKGGVSALKTKQSSESFDEDLHKKGFLNQYATSDVENDFNSFAKTIFKNEGDFWNLIKKYPRLKKKMEIIVAFYHQINEEFDLEYFQSVSE